MDKRMMGKEHDLENIEEKQQTLKLMEEDLQRQCLEFDQQKAALDVEKELLEQQKVEFAVEQKNLAAAVGGLNSSERFMKIQEMLNDVYTLYIAGGGSQEELFDSISLILQARSRFT
jgi:23S rRNA maturation-related 3'-5' exoribonuclease YhaM